VAETIQCLCRKIQAFSDKPWIRFLQPTAFWVKLSFFNVILMRQNPPVNTTYLHTTQLLSKAQEQGCFIINNPDSVRACNEKIFALDFPQCCPPSVVSAHTQTCLDFIAQHQKVALKSLESNGGRGVFIVEDKDPNIHVLLDLLTQEGRNYIMIQRYIPEIVDGDKRILLIDGSPFPFGLNRIPNLSHFRGNMVQGATGAGSLLNEREKWLCAQVGPVLQSKGLYFVGLDVIGGFITEINVTSPTCIREIDAACNVNISAHILDRLEKKLNPI
jgi:glutathione synthase